MLVKLPKEVSRIMAKLQESGFEAYIAGECIREYTAGFKPVGWDIATSAKPDDIAGILPEAQVFSKKFGVFRLEYIEEVLDKDGQTEGEKGIIVDVGTYRKDFDYKNGRPTNTTFADTIEEDLSRRDFTVNAVAEKQTEIADPYGGRDDMRKKLIRTIGDPDKRFKEDPVRMIRAVRLAAEMDFDLYQPVFDAISANHQLLDTADPKRVREEFSMLVTAGHAGKGLNMLMATGMISAILGQHVVDKLTKREMQDLTTLSENIDRTQPVEARRLGLFFACVSKKKAIPAIERLEFDETTRQHLIDAVSDLPKLYFTATKPTLKKFIYERGWERYDYLASMEKAQRIVFEYFSDTKIKSKMFLLQEIEKYREPIFVEDMHIDANDLIEAGICTKDNVDKILHMMIEELHTHPRKNTREELLKLAKLYSKNKLAAMFRGIHWTR